MNQNLFKIEAEIFHEARQIGNSAHREAFLRQRCGDQAELYDHLKKMLVAADDPTDLLPSPPEEFRWLRGAIGESSGASIGPYDLIRQIGEGGFGVVFEAEQQRPMRRRVALKILKPGMDTRQVVARFAAERQALALMDHPNIARVVDGGATESGRPYFVMELVSGVPIISYCQRHPISLRQQLQLFTTVCHAVQHAHQKGVIHRDLKPSNILVAENEGQPIAKIIDFGVAKALSVKLNDETLQTSNTQIVGTPLYMSPEQTEFGNPDIDTRTDIYALGVLLYELLTGSTPFDRDRLRAAGFDDVRRIIRDEEPPKPSTRVLALDETPPQDRVDREHSPRTLSRLLRGDLDWIAMKCLEKDRNRRYQSASDLANDLQRFLNSEPVEARPPSTAYKLRKLIKKHRRPAILAATFAMLALVGLVLLTWSSVRANRAEQQALQERDDAQQARNEAKQLAAIADAINEFLMIDLLSPSDVTDQADDTRNRDITVRQLLDRAAAKVDERFHGQPLVEAALRDTIGRTYRALGEPKQALLQLQRAVELRTRLLGPAHDQTLRACLISASSNGTAATMPRQNSR